MTDPFATEPSGRRARLRGVWTWVRPLGGLAIVAALVLRVGFGPFVEGIRTVDVRSVLVVVAITAVTTLGSAWRWHLVARALGVGVPVPRAFVAYYRSQFLNSALPGGVLGDVHRGFAHGREVGDTARALRAVAWERGAGQVVLVALTAVVLLVLPSPARAYVPFVLAALAVLVAAAVVLDRCRQRTGGSRVGRAVRTVTADARAVRPVWSGIVVASVLAVAGHVAVFLVAARAAGTAAGPSALLPWAMLVLVAMSVPLSVGGWGPREGVAGWAFGVAGLGVSQGVAAAVAYGVLAFVATAPGALVPAVTWWRGHRRADAAAGVAAAGVAAAAAVPVVSPVPDGLVHV